MRIIITESQYRILTEVYSEEEFREKYVDSGLTTHPDNVLTGVILETNFVNPKLK
jgi:hypothetical protein